MQEDTTRREPPPDTLVVQLTPCFCSPGSKVTFVLYATTNFVSALINLKGENMKEDVAQEPSPGNPGVQLALPFL